MSFTLVPGPRTWSVSRDDEGHRTYTVKFRVQGGAGDGPALALQCPGLPVAGSQWSFDSDADAWATCKQSTTATPVVEDEPNTLFDLVYTFSTKPDGKKCQDQQFDDPLTQPPKVSGTSSKFTQEATEDRLFQPIVNSAFEQIRGPQVEFDANRAGVKIEMNVASFSAINLALSLLDCVNNAIMWGQQARCVKLSTVNWEKKYYGLCYVYYTLTMDFDINPLTFDRRILDEGTKVLSGHWSPTTGAWVLDKIGGLPLPSAPVLEVVAGGTMSGTYSYRVTAFDAAGHESAAGPAKAITVPAGSKVKVTVPTVPGAASYTVYGRTAGSEKALQVLTTTQVWTDDATATPIAPFASAVVDGTGARSPDNQKPEDFIRFKDRHDENCKVILNGAGLPADVGVTQSATGTGTMQSPGYILVEKYTETNLLILGVPVTL